jgi:hypothetical protein
LRHDVVVGLALLPARAAKKKKVVAVTEPLLSQKTQSQPRQQQQDSLTNNAISAHMIHTDFLCSILTKKWIREILASFSCWKKAGESTWRWTMPLLA